MNTKTLVDVGGDSFEGEEDESPEIVDVIIFYCRGSDKCKHTITEINKMRPKIKIRTCDIVTAKARQLVVKSNMGIDSVPTMMVVLSDGTADIYKGRQKILSWVKAHSNSYTRTTLSTGESEEGLDDDDDMVIVEPMGKKKDIEFVYEPEEGISTGISSSGGLQDPSSRDESMLLSSATGKKLNFVFPQNGKPVAVKKNMDVGKEKYKDTMALAKQMKMDMQNTLGYSAPKESE